ncbi:MAG: glycosyltransferase family 4 protein [Carboxydocellales bacterium]
MRTYNLFKYIAQSFAVEVVSFTKAGELGIKEEIAPGLTEIQVPKSNEHQLKESEIERKLGIPITDVVMPRIAHLTPHYRNVLRKSLSNADLAVASHPYLINEILACAPKIPVVYDAQDIEFLLKKKVFPDNQEGQRLLQEVYQIEKMVCQDSILIFTCSEEDKNQLADLYNVSREKIIVVPNGADIKTVPFVASEERVRAIKQIGLKNPVVIFVGSWHPPNLEAAEQVFLMAEKLPHIFFGLVGSQCLAFNGKKLPGNVGLFGVVDHALKELIFRIADIALNPMLSGSGTNLKMLDYMAGGIPVISTPFGARGLQVKDDEELAICGINNFPEVIQELLDHPEKRARLVKLARATVEQRFDWEKIGNEAGSFIKNVIVKGNG